MQKAEKRLALLFKKFEEAGISVETVTSSEVLKKHGVELHSQKKSSVLKTLIVSAVIIGGIFVLRSAMDLEGGCLLRMPLDASKVFREPVSCSMCSEIFQVDKVKNISPWTFDKTYASTRRPVVVTDGTKKWKAASMFSFEFFRELYLSEDFLDDYDCQFFPYKTEFRSLREALNMSEDRAKLMPGTKSWYIGWSNCNNEVGKILRQYYETPYFLPPTSENIALSWIFIGGPGDGAHMHVDNVRFPSWQAQLKGRKKWKLAPPPECYFVCRELEVVVEPGEIIVVDTNRWYHQTFILPGELSITIGAEFD